MTKLEADKPNSWRIAQVAEREGRSLTSAMNFLLNMGYERWYAAIWDKNITVGAKPDETSPKEGSKYTSIYLKYSMYHDIARAAGREKRTISSFIKACISEGLERRRLASIDSGKVVV